MVRKKRVCGRKVSGAGADAEGSRQEGQGAHRHRLRSCPSRLGLSKAPAGGHEKRAGKKSGGYRKREEGCQSPIAAPREGDRGSALSRGGFFSCRCGSDSPVPAPGGVRGPAGFLPAAVERL